MKHELPIGTPVLVKMIITEHTTDENYPYRATPAHADKPGYFRAEDVFPMPTTVPSPTEPTHHAAVLRPSGDPPMNILNSSASFEVGHYGQDPVWFLNTLYKWGIEVKVVSVGMPSREHDGTAVYRVISISQMYRDAVAAKAEPMYNCEILVDLDGLRWVVNDYFAETQEYDLYRNDEYGNQVSMELSREHVEQKFKIAPPRWNVGDVIAPHKDRAGYYRITGINHQEDFYEVINIGEGRVDHAQYFLVENWHLVESEASLLDAEKKDAETADDA